MTEVIHCTSCKVNVANQEGTAIFNCPNCGKTQIIRCPTCRKIVAKYKCSSCQFEGPN